MFVTQKICGTGCYGVTFLSMSGVFYSSYPHGNSDIPTSQTFKHIFTSPSSVDKEAKATRSGNARIHGMTRVTPASLAYVATQVSSVFKFRLAN